MSIRVDVSFRIPEPYGANVVSNPENFERIEQLRLRVTPMTKAPSSSHDLEDAGAMGIAIMGSVVGAAAIKGLFDLLQTLLREAGELRRMKLTQEHERAIAVLTIAGNTTELNLEKLELAVEKLEALARSFTEDPSR